MNGNVDGEEAPAVRTCVGNRYRFDTRPSPMALKPSQMATQSPSNPRTQAPFAKISIIYALGIQNLRWKGLNRAKSKKVSSEPLLWLGAGSPPAKDGTKTIEETPREVGEPARHTTP